MTQGKVGGQAETRSHIHRLELDGEDAYGPPGWTRPGPFNPSEST